MQYVLIDGREWLDLCPLTLTRSLADLRIGIDTIFEKWQSALEVDCQVLTVDYLQIQYPLLTTEDTICINSSFLPSSDVVNAIRRLQKGQMIMVGDHVVACFNNPKEASTFISNPVLANPDNVVLKLHANTLIHIQHPWDLFLNNSTVLKSDFERITKGKKSASLHDSNTLIGHQIFLEEGAESYGAIFNTLEGPVYLGKHSQVMEGSSIRGGLALCEHSVIKMQAKIYGATTFGPHCKVGGEVTNSIFQAYTNKSHDGYLGNSVIGAWCNFGADTNSSNLKNNLRPVKSYSYRHKQLMDTDQQFLGLVMGDHCKTGINAMFNTGTVVGVSCNIFGSGFPEVFIPSFSWVDQGNIVPYRLDKALEVSDAMMNRRNKSLSESEKQILTHIAEMSSEFTL